MTTSPTQPDLRRLIFKPGDRVTTNYTAATGTVQPYPVDTVVLEVLFDGENQPVAFYVEELLDLLTLVEPAPVPGAPKVVEVDEAPRHRASAYLAAVNLLYLTELLDGRHDVSLYIGWDGSGGRETTLHLSPSTAAFADGAALAARIGLTNYEEKPHKGDVQHCWTGDRHGLPVRVLWIDRAAAGWRPEAEKPAPVSW